jgi:hypothetical protein
LVLAVVSSFDVGLTVHDERLIFAFVMSSEVEISLNLAAEANFGSRIVIPTGRDTPVGMTERGQLLGRSGLRIVAEIIR